MYFSLQIRSRSLSPNNWSYTFFFKIKNSRWVSPETSTRKELAGTRSLPPPPPPRESVYESYVKPSPCLRLGTCVCVDGLLTLCRGNFGLFSAGGSPTLSEGKFPAERRFAQVRQKPRDSAAEARLVVGSFRLVCVRKLCVLPHELGKNDNQQLKNRGNASTYRVGLYQERGNLSQRWHGSSSWSDTGLGGSRVTRTRMAPRAHQWGPSPTK